MLLGRLDSVRDLGLDPAVLITRVPRVLEELLPGAPTGRDALRQSHVGFTDHRVFRRTVLMGCVIQP